MAYGGMMQYTQWVDPMLTVTDFYTNDTVKVCVLLNLSLWILHAD